MLHPAAVAGILASVVGFGMWRLALSTRIGPALRLPKGRTDGAGLAPGEAEGLVPNAVEGLS